MIVGLLTLLILYALLFGLAEALYRRGVDAEITRKLSHMGGAIISFFLPLLVSLPLALTVGVFFRFS